MIHLDVVELDPDSFDGLLALSERASASAAAAGVDPRLIELVQIRVSQLNGCAFCLTMHTAGARAAGETSERLALLPAWWESSCFTAQERAALQLAESITLVSDHGRLPGRGVEVEAVLDPPQISSVTWLSVVINAWNRIMITTGAQGSASR